MTLSEILRLIITMTLFFILYILVDTNYTIIENQNKQITNQGSIILLLSKDYPELVIGKTKKNKVLIKKLKGLEKELSNLLDTE